MVQRGSRQFLTFCFLVILTRRYAVPAGRAGALTIVFLAGCLAVAAVIPRLLAIEFFTDGAVWISVARRTLLRSQASGSRRCACIYRIAGFAAERRMAAQPTGDHPMSRVTVIGAWAGDADLRAAAARAGRWAFLGRNRQTLGRLQRVLSGAGGYFARDAASDDGDSPSATVSRLDWRSRRSERLSRVVDLAHRGAEYAGRLTVSAALFCAHCTHIGAGWRGRYRAGVRERRARRLRSSGGGDGWRCRGVWAPDAFARKGADWRETVRALALVACRLCVELGLLHHQRAASRRSAGQSSLGSWSVVAYMCG